MELQQRVRLPRSRLDLTNIQLLLVGDAESETGGVLDMPRLPDVVIRIGIPAEPGFQIVLGAIPNGDGLFLAPLLLDHVEQDSIQRNRVRSKHDPTRVKAELLVRSEWST